MSADLRMKEQRQTIYDVHVFFIKIIKYSLFYNNLKKCISKYVSKVDFLLVVAV